jgi:hypothetical protein
MRVVRRLGLITVGAGIAAVTCGLAIAAGVTLPFTGDGNTISGCYSTGGARKLRTPAEPTCPKGYTAIEWSVTGPQGAQGPQGPAGATGPQGPPGPAATIDSFRTFEVEVSKDVGFFNFGSAFAECPPGSIRTGGGVFVTDGDIKASEPSGDNGWKASASTGVFGGYVHAIAVCMTST